MIKFFIFIMISILLITNSFSLEKSTSKKIINKTEQLLAETADNISEGKIEAALQSVKGLIDMNPNFKLAHMIHGDLLLIQSHNYDQVSEETYKHYEKKISDLKLELSRRIESYKNLDKNLIQSKIKVLLFSCL